MGVISGSVKVAGLDCQTVKIGKPPAPDAWAVYAWDSATKLFVNICPEPQATEQEAIAVAESVASDPMRYARCLVGAANVFNEESRNRSERDIYRINVRIDTLEAIMAKAFRDVSTPDTTGAAK